MCNSILRMATAGDSWYPALLGLADSFRQANNIKVRPSVMIVTSNICLDRGMRYVGVLSWVLSITSYMTFLSD